MKRAIIFPGQGSQYIGMGKDLYENFAKAREIFSKADDLLDYNLSNKIFNGSIEELSKTIYTQPAIMITSLAILNVIEHLSGKNISEIAQVTAGHSLGEYSSLVAASVLNLEDALQLINLRARSMDEVSKIENGAMAAILGLSKSKLKEIISFKEGLCEIANDNSESQIVISGLENEIENAINILKQNGAKAIKLNVSGAFHSKLMEPVSKSLKSKIDQIEFQEPKMFLISNTTATLTKDTQIIKNALVKQVYSEVRWTETIDQIQVQDINNIISIGPSNVLTNLAKKSKHNFNVLHVESIEDIEGFISKI